MCVDQKPSCLYQHWIQKNKKRSVLRIAPSLEENGEEGEKRRKRKHQGEEGGKQHQSLHTRGKDQQLERRAEEQLNWKEREGGRLRESEIMYEWDATRESATARARLGDRQRDGKQNTGCRHRHLYTTVLNASIENAAYYGAQQRLSVMKLLSSSFFWA